MRTKKAVLRVTGRTLRQATARVRAGEKGTGKVLATLPVPGFLWTDPLYRLAEKAAKECGVKVLVETMTAVDDCCCVVYSPDVGHCQHLPTRHFRK